MFKLSCIPVFSIQFLFIFGLSNYAQAQSLFNSKELIFQDISTPNSMKKVGQLILMENKVIV
jgi:hypothetical protein